MAKLTAWLVYDQGRAEVNSWLIAHYLERAPHHGIDLKLMMANDASRSLADGCAPDVAIMRCIDLTLHQHLEAAGVRVYNSAKVSEITNNKDTCYEFARELGVPVLDYQVLHPGDEEPTGVVYPAVAKPLDGHGGQGVQLVETPAELDRYRREHPGDVIVQELADTPGKDVRVYVLGGTILAAVERTARGGQLRANFTLGGSARLIEPTPLMRRWVSIINAALLIDYAGIDFLYHAGGVVLGEIEDVVGARMLYDLTNIDVVDEHLQLIARNHAA